MTFNIISDIHCGYNPNTEKIVWNRDDHVDINYLPERYISDEEYTHAQRLEAIHELVLVQNDLIKEKNIPRVALKRDYNMNNKAEYRKFFFVDPIITKKQCIERIQHVIDALYKETAYENIDADVTSINKFIRKKTSLQFHYYPIANPVNRMISDFVPEKLQPADYLLIAGDLGLDRFYNKVYEEIAERTKHLFKDVFFIKGNHDYWDNTFTKDKINLNDRYLERALSDEVVLLGCTMWSPIPPHKEWTIARGMNDFTYIPHFRPSMQTEIYQEDLKWIKQKVDGYSGKKIILMTHHLPNFDVIADQYKHSDCNEAYAVMDGSTKDIKPLVWVHGHSHQFFDKTLDGVRYIRNPIGYREHYGYLPSEVYSSHWYNTIIEV